MHVLIVDDEANIRKTTSMALESMGHETDTAANGDVAMEFLRTEKYDAIFLDLRLGDEDGMELIDRMLEKSGDQKIVVFTAHSSIETAVEAMRRGAHDYIPKPFTPDQIRHVLATIAKTKRLEKRVADLESKLNNETPEIDLTTQDPATRTAYDIALKAASSSASLLILGESGTGKSVLARAVHERSPLRENPLVTVNCPCLSKELLTSELFGHVKGAFTGATMDTWGKVATADGGTLFLDEIGELPLEIQPKLLRLLHEREYERVGETKVRHANVRVIAASNRDLARCVQEKTFREDLYYRLNVISVLIPPLRSRTGDIMRFAGNYLQFFASQAGKRVSGFTPAATHALQCYHWPGNLRELRNVIERAVILSETSRIDTSDLPESTTGMDRQAHIEIGSNLSLEQLEQEHIQRVVARTRTLEEAAQILDVDPATLYRKRKKWESVESR